MKSIINKTSMKLKLFSVGALTTLSTFFPFGEKKNNNNYNKILDNQNKFYDHMNQVNSAKHVVDTTNIEIEIEKRVKWFQKDLLEKIKVEDRIVKGFEHRVKTAFSKKEARVVDMQLDYYITKKYLDDINTEREINNKEPYCLGFAISNMLNYKELRKTFNDFPGVTKLANKYFINQAKESCKGHIHNAKMSKVKPEIGDIIVIRRPDNSHHAVTYIGKNKTFSANGNDHGGRSELKEVKFSYWWAQASSLYVFKSKDIVKEYWKDKFENSKMSKLDFLAELYEGRKLPKEIDLLLKERDKAGRSFYLNSDTLRMYNKVNVQKDNLDIAMKDIGKEKLSTIIR